MEVDSTSLPPQSRGRLKYWIIIAGLLIYGVAITAVFIFKGNPSSAQVSKITPPDSGKLFTNQSAIFNGKITEVNGSRIKVTNTLNGEMGTLELADNVQINDSNLPHSPGEAITKNIQPNTEANIILNIIDGKYKVIVINSNSQAITTKENTQPIKASDSARLSPNPSIISPIVKP